MEWEERSWKIFIFKSLPQRMAAVIGKKKVILNIKQLSNSFPSILSIVSHETYYHSDPLSYYRNFYFLFLFHFNNTKYVEKEFSLAWQKLTTLKNAHKNDFASFV